MSERFIIQAVNADGLPITEPQETRSEDGYLKDLTIEGTLTMGTVGKITNTAGTYIIDEDGIKFLDAVSAVFDLGIGGRIIGSGNSSFVMDAAGAFTYQVGTDGSPAFVGIINFLSDLTNVGGINLSTNAGFTEFYLDISVLTELRYNAIRHIFETGTVAVPNATANGHALNRVTADGRYVMPTAFTEDAATSISATGSLVLNVNGENYKFIVEKQP